MNTINFQNRQSVNPGRKKLTIVNQTSNTMIVDVENADNPTQEGTPINASTMSALQSEIVEVNNTLDFRLDKRIKYGLFGLPNSTATVQINTGLTSVDCITLTLKLNSTVAACRTVMVRSISGGTVTCDIRNTYNGGVESIGNATDYGFSIYWIAIGSSDSNQ